MNIGQTARDAVVIKQELLVIHAGQVQRVARRDGTGLHRRSRRLRLVLRTQPRSGGPAS